MNWPGQERWERLWQAAGSAGTPAGWYEKLTAAYAEPQRHYHNQQHIADCLAEFEQARHLTQHPVEVEFALWFHDAVYEPKAKDNEEQSAAMARDCLDAGGAAKLAATVTQLILATKTHETGAGADPDTALMVDVDLSILGQGEQRFAEYEQQIREEYRWVPKLLFNFKRGQILKEFLARPRIYATDFFASKYEEKARCNLENAIRRSSLL